MSASQRVWNNTNSTTSGMRKEALRWGQGISSCIFWQVESTCLALDTRHSSTAKYFPDDVSVEANSIVCIMVLLALKNTRRTLPTKTN